MVDFAKRRAGAGLAAALVLGPSIALDQAAPAETPAVRQGRMFLTAVATADDAAFLAILHQAYPSSKMTDAEWLSIRPNWKGFEFHGVERSTPTQAELQVLDRARDGWVRALVTVEPQPPYAITDFSIHGGHRPADVPAPPKLAPEVLVAAARAFAAGEAAADRFSGVVLIARGGRPLFRHAFGLADRAARRPVTLDTRLRIGSMGKMFTTIAALQLAQAGKLDLDSPLARYLPDYPNPEAARTVTAGQLANHTGGMGDFFGPEFEAHRDSLVDPKDYVARFGARPLLFSPGSRAAYSNYGYILLGRVIEAASGEAYDAFVQRHIFAPAGMTASGFEPETVPVPGRAVGYATQDGRLVPATKFQVFRGTPGGGGYSSGPDLLRFADALMSNRLLDADHTARVTSVGVRLADGTTSYYDFGGRKTAEGQRWYGHGGGAPGQNGLLQIFPDSGYTVVVLANRDPPAAERIAKFITDRIA